MTIDPRPTPEAEHLAEQESLLAELVDQLARQEEALAESASQLAKFREEYLRRFGPLYAEYDRLQAEIARRIAESSGTPEAINEAEDAARRATASQESTGDEAQPQAPVLSRQAPSPDLKALFREAAKRIHPDLATDEDEKSRRHELMAALNAAYDQGDAQAIQNILAGEDARPEAITGDDVGARLMRTIRKIAQVRRRFTELVSLTESLEADPLYRLFQECRDLWEAGDDPLALDEAALRERIAESHIALAQLIAEGARAQRSLS